MYVKTREQSLLTIRNNELTPVQGGDKLATAAVEDAVALNGEALIATADRLYRVGAAGVEAFPTSADRYFNEQIIYSMAMLPNGEIAVGTRKGGLVLLNRAGS